MARPKGIIETKPRNTVAKKVAAIALRKGITPLDVMLTAMEQDWNEAQALARKPLPDDLTLARKHLECIAGLRASAIATADKAAPYVHARLSAMAVKDMTPPDPVDAEKRALMRAELIRRLDLKAVPEPLPPSDPAPGKLR
jgi:hypothetical protein